MRNSSIALALVVPATALAQPVLEVLPAGGSTVGYTLGDGSTLGTSAAENVQSVDPLIVVAGTQTEQNDGNATLSAITTARASLTPWIDEAWAYSVRIETAASADIVGPAVVSASATSGADLIVNLTADRDYLLEIGDVVVSELTGDACVACEPGDTGPVWRVFVGADFAGGASFEPSRVVFLYAGDALQLDATVNAAAAALTPSPASANSRFEGTWPATLTGTCYHDLNGDGVIDSGDINLFIPLFLNQNLGVDYNRDGLIDFGDVGAFIERFLAGCDA